MRVSVILPLHDPGPEVEAALTRLAHTLGPRDELIIVDDGTPVPHGSALARRVERSVPRARLLRLGSNRGAAAARNHALERARGRWVWFVDWDDDWDPTILDVLVAAGSTRADSTVRPVVRESATPRARAGGRDAQVVTCRASVVDEHGRLVRHIGPAHDRTLTGPQTAQALLDGRLEGHLWNKLFRRDVLPPGVFPLQPTQSDLVGTAPVLAAADRVEHVGQVLYEHRIRAGSLTAAADRDLAPLIEAGTRVPELVAPHVAGVPDADRLATLFRHRSAYLTAVTAQRLHRDAGERATWTARSRELVTAREAVALLPRTPGTAARSLALVALGRHFGAVYRRVAGWRGAAPRHAYRAPWTAPERPTQLG